MELVNGAQQERIPYWRGLWWKTDEMRRPVSDGIAIAGEIR